MNYKSLLIMKFSTTIHLKILLFAINGLFLVSSSEICGRPSFPHNEKFAPILDKYSNGQKIDIFCENEYIDIIQSKTCSNGKWTENELFCGPKTHRHLNEKTKMVFTYSENGLMVDCRDCPIRDDEGIGNRCYISFNYILYSLGHESSKINVILVLGEAISVALVRLRLYHTSAGATDFNVSVGPYRNCKSVYPWQYRVSVWPSYKINKEGLGCENSDYLMKCEVNNKVNEDSWKNITLTFNMKFFSELCGLDLYLVEPYPEEVTIPTTISSSSFTMSPEIFSTKHSTTAYLTSINPTASSVSKTTLKFTNSTRSFLSSSETPMITMVTDSSTTDRMAINHLIKTFSADEKTYILAFRCVGGTKIDVDRETQKIGWVKVAEVTGIYVKNVKDQSFSNELRQLQEMLATFRSNQFGSKVEYILSVAINSNEIYDTVDGVRYMLRP